MARLRKTVKPIAKKVKAKRANYTEDDLKNALNEMKNGISCNFESKKYKIPRTTLAYKSKGNRPEKKCKPGPQCVLGTYIYIIFKSGRCDIGIFREF